MDLDLVIRETVEDLEILKEASAQMAEALSEAVYAVREMALKMGTGSDAVSSALKEIAEAGQGNSFPKIQMEGLQEVRRQLGAMDLVSQLLIRNGDPGGSGGGGSTGIDAGELAEKLSSMIINAQGNAGSAAGDIVIPVYIGGEQIDEVLITAQQRLNLVSGGR